MWICILSWNNLLLLEFNRFCFTSWIDSFNVWLQNGKNDVVNGILSLFSSSSPSSYRSRSRSCSSELFSDECGSFLSLFFFKLEEFVLWLARDVELT